MTIVHGLILAAGAGRRRGFPKALVPGALDGAVAALTGGGCTRVVVVLGAAAEQAAPLVPPEAEVVHAADWADGMGASLRTGLAALDDPARGTAPDAAVIHLVDIPDVGADVVRRLVARASPDILARAVYRSAPGHPVLMGRTHFAAAAESAVGDRGARDYLSARTVDGVECGDLASGDDVDTPSG
ncbi:MAG: nucleotidyltransferase family protein [Gordonia sp. (in: high G+C Gram-positive bacteria)]